ncbi:hypothetical protein V2J09_007482 [Rumex salicifolius]
MKLLKHLMLILLLNFSLTQILAKNEITQKKTYIVHMDRLSMPEGFEEHQEWYSSSLRAASEAAEMLYTYNTVIQGFSTRLTLDEAESLKKLPGILSLIPEAKYELHTTRTPLFLGLETEERRLPASTSSSDVIVGILDTGVWPEMKGFDDRGLGPVPATWKGECEVGTNFNSSYCNKKLIGARAFYKGYEATFGPIDETQESKSPRDDDGHGTHTSTTAAGSAVTGASLFGYAAGVARGMAPRARIAAYKACWSGGCFGTDILAAMDKAVEDGVDIMSLSIGGGTSDYDRDTVALGAFKALTKGIFVSTSAGNGGPGAGTLSNVAPWITTVGAGTLDRDFPAFVTLGNGNKLAGVSLYSGKPLPNRPISLVYAANASSMPNADLCMSTLSRKLVAGKIVVCNRGGTARVQKGVVVKASGGIGMILANTDTYGEELVADSHLLPASAVGQKAGDAIKKYIVSSPKPTAKITFEGTHLGVEPSPVVAAFSSRGPNPITPQILKPDFIAPGVNILAGWTSKVGPTGMASDKRSVSFNIISGTSMSCPHVSGLAALVKATHPDWSPSAIRSALMTTAYTAYKTGAPILDVATGSKATPFDYGAGHVDPVAALDPGLVYDATVEDYVGFLCALNYTSDRVKTLAGKSYGCLPSKKYRLEDFNYPSFSVPFETASGVGGGSSSSLTTVKYTRTLTNVGSPGTYKASVSSGSASVQITVEPESLTFSTANEKKSYTVTFASKSMPSGTNSFARLVWSDAKHTVGSSIALSWT